MYGREYLEEAEAQHQFKRADRIVQHLKRFLDGLDDDVRWKVKSQLEGKYGGNVIALPQGANLQNLLARQRQQAFQPASISPLGSIIGGLFR